jgi:hypothetical protein
MSDKKGTINENDLMQRLVGAKKVMNAVDGKTYKTGNIDPTVLTQSNDKLVSQVPTTNPNLKKPVGSNVVNEDKIRNSKLPDSIKEAMIKNPIPTMDEISLSDGLDMSFVEGAKKLMEREGLTKKQPQQTIQQPTQNTSDLKSLIKETIKDTLEEIVDRKLELILTASKTASVNETLVLKVGDSIFKGKITGVNKAK